MHFLTAGRTIFIALLLTFLMVPSISHTSTLTMEVKLLGRCHGIFLYATNAAQMLNNEGLTKNMAFRSSLVGAAFLIEIDDGGELYDEPMLQIKKLQKSMKAKFDTGRANIWAEADKCTQSALPLANSVARSGKRFRGSTYEEQQKIHLETIYKNLGLN